MPDREPKSEFVNLRLVAMISTAWLFANCPALLATEANEAILDFPMVCLVIQEGSIF